MEFQFGKYTEITDFAFKINPQYKNEKYIRFFICPDVWDNWFVRVLDGYNEEYEPEEGKFLIERNNISKDHRSDKLSINKVKQIILDDDGSNWDILAVDSMEDVIEQLDAGFGILNLK